MSRICVKNLPKYASEDRLRELFSQKGEITDAKLMRTKDGKSRQFGFIGYRSEREAEEAIKYFNESYLDTCRISCEIARKVGDPDIPRPWSRHSVNKEAKATNDEKKLAGTKLGASKGEGNNLKKGFEEDEPKLQEFLQVTQPRAKSKIWANDMVVTSAVDQNGKVSDKQSQAKKESKENLVPMNVEIDKVDKTEHEISDTRAANRSENPVRNEIMTDMDYFKSRVKTEWSDSESSDDDDNDGSVEDGDRSLKEIQEGQRVQEVDSERKVGSHDEIVEVDPKMDPDKDIRDGEKHLSTLKNDKEEVLETGRLFVRNLPYTATEEELEEHFSKFGSVSEVHLVVDKDTKRSKGIAYILYTLPESAARALKELDSSIFQGRLLHVMPANQKKPTGKHETDEFKSLASKSFKQKRDDERKASEASGDTRAWNTLFMRPDTVVENIARKYGVSKADLLDREADDLAVRMALGETQVVADTKKTLANAGVNVASLEEFASGKTDGLKRSNHVLLVKNLPYGSSEGELASMFGKYGSLEKIILPPTKTLALVVFLEPSEARAAFKGLAYKRYKDAPLYLEWAPANVLGQSSTSDSNENNKTIVGEHDAKRAILEQKLEGISDMDIDPDRVESRSLYVKNLNFKTTDESLKKHFGEHMKEGRILSVKIQKHLKNGKNVSKGYGFIEFDSVETATNVCSNLQGTILDGHALISQICHAKHDDALKKVEKYRSSTKLLVRNVAFEATEKDLRQLFSPFGQIKSLRLPKKFGNHRGFAFVEYVTKQEAENAVKTLSNTHLYGRHLVLEKAKEGESLEELRARTAAQFADEENGFQNPTKLSKKRKHMAILDEGSVKFERIAD